MSDLDPIVESRRDILVLDLKRNRQAGRSIATSFGCLDLADRVLAVELVNSRTKRKPKTFNFQERRKKSMGLRACALVDPGACVDLIGTPSVRRQPGDRPASCRVGSAGFVPNFIVAHDFSQ